MSGPLSSPEIEDVVSSVRRLVSTTHLPRVKTRDLAHDKLILTPSLRVVPEVEPEAAVRVVAENQVAEAATEEAPEAVASGFGVGEAAATPDAEVAEFAPQDPATDVPLAEAVPEAPFIEVETPDAQPEGVLHLVEAEWEDELWTEDEASLAEIAAEVEDAELILAEEPAAETVAEAVPEDVILPVAEAASETDWPDDMPVPFVLRHRVTDPQPETIVDEPLPEMAEAPVAESLVSDIPIAETAIAEAAIDEAWAPEVQVVEMPVAEFEVSDTSAADVPAGDSLFAAEPVAEHEVADAYGDDIPVAEGPAVEMLDEALVAEIADQAVAASIAEEDLADAQADGQPKPETETLLFDHDGTPLAVLDEEALHDIVRNLIREELQGALGERITRNVRKLVRAEINRALAARELG